MAIDAGTTDIKALRVGSTVISRAFLGNQKIYDQLDYPTLDLNFALTKTLDPRITFTRASSGTFFDSNGAIQTAPVNTPRFDHDPLTGESLGLLIEEQRTNSIRNNTMQGAVAGTPGTLPTNWVVGTFAGLTTNIIATGTENGVNYVDIQFAGTSTGAACTLFFESVNNTTALNGQSWASSLFCKIVGGSTTNIISINNNVTFRNSGSTSLQSLRTAMTLTSTLTRYLQVVTSSNASTAFVQSGLWIAMSIGSAIDITLRIGLPQLELGAFATSVVPTSGSVATRNDDGAVITGTNFSSWYNQSEGTLYSEATFTNTVSFNTVTALSDGTTNNTMRTIQWNNGTDRIFIIATSGIPQASYSSTGQVGTAKFAVAYKLNDVNASKNGSIDTTNTLATPPTVNRLFLGQTLLNTFILNGYLRRITYFNRRLANSELQLLSS